MIPIIRPNNIALHQRSRVNQVNHMKRIFNYLTPINPIGFSKSRSFRLQLCSIASAGFAYLALSSTAVLGQGTPETISAVEDERKQVETATAIDGTNPTVDQEFLIGPRALSRAFRNAAKRATPAVVTILSYGQQAPSGGQPQGPADGEGAGSNNEQDLTGVGSGVIVSPDGRVITNNHVVAGAKRVVVKLADETEVEATEVRGDPDSDVATFRLVRDEPFANAEMADSDLLEIGDWVLAIGSPFRLEATVSAGIISAKNRTLQTINRGRLIQTDAAINPGNSGGPLIDLDGKVVAISTAIATRNGGYQGIGFAIPIKQASWIANELATHGSVRRAAIGVRMAELNPKIASRFNLPTGLGVLAYQIIEDSAAERGGIKPLDVIMEFAGERVRDPGALQEVIERLPVGSTQSVKVFRDGEEVMLEVTLATLEDPTLKKENDQE